MVRPLTVVEEGFILYNMDNLTPAQIAKKIKGVGPATVKKFIEEEQEKCEVTDEPDEEVIASPLTPKDLLARDSKGTAVAMTEAASVLADDTRDERVSKTPPQKDRIHRPLGDNKSSLEAKNQTVKGNANPTFITRDRK